MKIDLVEKFPLGLESRDGNILIGKAGDGTCFIIAEADTYHNTEVFQGLGSTQYIRISEAAYMALREPFLALVKAMDRAITRRTEARARIASSTHNLPAYTAEELQK